LTRKQSEVITSKISLIAVPYDHREKIIPSWLCVWNSVIILFPETNHVGDKIFRSELEIMLEKYFNVFEDAFEKSNTLWKCLSTFLFGKLKYKKYLNTFKYKYKCIWPHTWQAHTIRNYFLLMQLIIFVCSILLMIQTNILINLHSLLNGYILKPTWLNLNNCYMIGIFWNFKYCCL